MGSFDYLFRTPKEENVKPCGFGETKKSDLRTYSDYQAQGIIRDGGSWRRLPEANLQNPGKGGRFRSDGSLPPV
jgi:hypothetical protein